MDRFFNNNNPLMQFLTRLVDLAIVNLMTVAVMIPVVTAGPALAAMNNVLIHMVRQDGSSPWKQYRKALKQNMRQGIGLGLIFLGAGAAAGADLFLLHAIDSKASTLLMIIITVIGICAFVIGIYAFALQSRYENTIRGTLLNAAGLAMTHIPRSLAMAAIWAVWAVFLWYIHGIALLVYVIYGLSLPAGACTLLYDPIFQKMEEEMEEDPEEDADDDQQ
ncbi:MAG: YesL family protein [Firmicutes bacterium]|nr:YesL family protein [Bacillota bacterium]